MAFQRPTLPELVDRVQSDLTSRLALVGAVLRRSVVYIVARVIAAAAHLLHGHPASPAQQSRPDTSELEFLERQASLYGVTRLAAAYATGDVTLTGLDGIVVPAATVVQR